MNSWTPGKVFLYGLLGAFLWFAGPTLLGGLLLGSASLIKSTQPPPPEFKYGTACTMQDDGTCKPLPKVGSPEWEQDIQVFIKKVEADKRAHTGK
jgi:hypothetical protein